MLIFFLENVYDRWTFISSFDGDFSGQSYQPIRCTKPRADCPKNAPIFVSRRLQLFYAPPCRISFSDLWEPLESGAGRSIFSTTRQAVICQFCKNTNLISAIIAAVYEKVKIYVTYSMAILVPHIKRSDGVSNWQPFGYLGRYELITTCKRTWLLNLNNPRENSTVSDVSPNYLWLRWFFSSAFLSIPASMTQTSQTFKISSGSNCLSSMFWLLKPSHLSNIVA